VIEGDPSRLLGLPSDVGWVARVFCSYGLLK